MRVLALDTTTRRGSAAVIANGRVLAVREGNDTRGHGERLPTEIAQLLADADVRIGDLDLLVVASGPGAFTGLRIGLATMQGLASVRQCPVIGVSALEARACATWGFERSPRSPDDNAARPAQVVTLSDAWRGEVYAALYGLQAEADGKEPWAERRAPVVLSPSDLLDAWTDALQPGTVFVGDGAAAHAPLLQTRLPGLRVEPSLTPLTPALAWIGERRARRGEAGTPETLEPLYVRRPDAERDRARRASA